MNNYKLLIILGEPILISDEEIKDYSYPMLVAEKLTTGDWQVWQIDNPNDIDTKNQRKIIAGIPETPHLDFSILTNEEFNSIKHCVDVEIEMEEFLTNIISGGLRPIGEIGGKGLTRHSIFKPKISNNSIKITKIL